MKNIAIITGASSGMGKEFAEHISKKTFTEKFLSKGREALDEIWIIARREDKLLEIAEKINSENHFNIVRPVPLDISGKEGVLAFKKIIDAETEKLSKIESSLNISILINNAGFGTYGPFEETPFEREMEMTDLNCTTLVGFTGVCLPYMKKGGIIINTGSLASFLPLGEFAVYGATKSYVLSFSVALAAELKSRGITVTAMCPGPVSTDFANVASGGARPKVKHGLDAGKVVAHCLKKALKGKRIAIYAFKWKFKKAASRFVPRYLGAWFTFKYCKRPHSSPDGEVNI